MIGERGPGCPEISGEGPKNRYILREAPLTTTKLGTTKRGKGGSAMRYQAGMRDARGRDGSRSRQQGILGGDSWCHISRGD